MKTVFIFLLLISTTIYGQNLVPNGGFEENVECPDDYPGNGDVYLAEPWVGFSADYIHVCAGQDPFYQELGAYTTPLSGNGYVRIATYLTDSYNTREFIEVELTEPLEVGEYYCVEYYCKLNAAYGIGTDGMGAFFTEEFAEYEDLVIFEEGIGNRILPEAQIISPIIHDDTLKYSQVSGSFIADKVYNYVTIGNFVNDNKLETKNVLNPLPDWGGGASYAIDDIAVWKCSVDVDEKNLVERPTVYSTTDGLYVKHLKDPVVISIYNLQGALVTQKSFDTDRFWDLSDLPAGMYVYKFNNEYGSDEVGKIICY